MTNSALPIGIFDSGVGGITVLKEIRNRLPHEDIIYLGDTARLPYGTKSTSTVEQYAEGAAKFLLKRGIKILVVACNTASAVALKSLTERCFPVPVVGVVKPGANKAVVESDNQRHLILATEATTRELAYTKAILELEPDAVCQEIACPMFVALAEEGWGEGKIAVSVADKYLGFFKDQDHGPAPDTAILGCTHFPLLRDSISQVLGEGIKIIDSASTSAEQVVEVLREYKLKSDKTAVGRVEFLATEGVERFARVGGNFLGTQLSKDDIEVVDINLF
ncbi:MAG: glutamate racemase [Pseudomonadota bacterium]|nr:glutamate racemase [Pseudomonadota bacterium]